VTVILFELANERFTRAQCFRCGVAPWEKDDMSAEPVRSKQDDDLRARDGHGVG
jgi:hypothetical protein